MDLSVFFAGTGGAVPAARRGMPAVLVKAGGDRMLFDCGEGTQRQLVRSVGLAALDHIFITHFHADHWLGLPGMLRTFDLQDRGRPISVHGPPGLQALFEQMRAAFGSPEYGIDVVEHDVSGNDELVVLRREGRHPYSVVAFPVDHGQRRAFGYAVIEDERPGAFDPDAARAAGVADVRDFGRLQRGETVEAAGGTSVEPGQVMGPARRGRKVVITGDTRQSPVVAGAARGADVLVHEATFTAADADRADATAHSTAEQAAAVAAQAGVKVLALVHLSQRTLPRDVLTEAQAAFPGGTVIVPRDFDALEIPFPEDGPPRHVEGEPERARDVWAIAEGEAEA